MLEPPRRRGGSRYRFGMAERRSSTLSAGAAAGGADAARAPGEVGGIAVNALRRGRAREAGDLPVLVLHGWGAHLAAVEPIVAALAGETEVLALDLPGFGESGDPPGPWASEDYARFVAEWLAVAGVERCHLVGHSLGGRDRDPPRRPHPELVGGSILCDSAGLPPKRGWRYRYRVALAKLGRLLGLLGPPGRRAQERIRARVASTDYLEASPAMRETFRRVIAEDLSDLLPRISAPCLLVWGDADEDTPPWMGERMAGCSPDGALVLLEGAGHFSYAEQPARFARLARHFLCEQPRQAAGAGGPGREPPGERARLGRARARRHDGAGAARRPPARPPPPAAARALRAAPAARLGRPSRRTPGAARARPRRRRGASARRRPRPRPPGPRRRDRPRRPRPRHPPRPRRAAPRPGQAARLHAARDPHLRDRAAARRRPAARRPDRRRPARLARSRRPRARRARRRAAARRARAARPRRPCAAPRPARRQRPLRAPRPPPPARGRAARDRDHRLLRQDDDQGLRRPRRRPRRPDPADAGLVQQLPRRRSARSTRACVPTTAPSSSRWAPTGAATSPSSAAWSSRASASSPRSAPPTWSASARSRRRRGRRASWPKGCPPTAVFLTRADDARCRAAAERAPCPVRLFAPEPHPDAAAWAEGARLDEGRSRFDLCLRGAGGEVARHPVAARLLGGHNVANLLAAAAGRRRARPRAGADRPRPRPGRARPSTGSRRSSTAPPGSSSSTTPTTPTPRAPEAALEVLAAHPGERRVLVTPGMVELGDARGGRERALRRRRGRRPATSRSWSASSSPRRSAAGSKRPASRPPRCASSPTPGRRAAARRGLPRAAT